MLGTNVHGRPALLIVIARLLICVCSLQEGYLYASEVPGLDQSPPRSRSLAWWGHEDGKTRPAFGCEELEDSIAAPVVKPYSSAWYPQVAWKACTKDPYMSPICISDVPSDGQSSDGEVSDGESSDGECFVSGLLSYTSDYDAGNGVHSYLYVRVSVCSFVFL